MIWIADYSTRIADWDYYDTEGDKNMIFDDDRDVHGCQRFVECNMAFFNLATCLPCYAVGLFISFLVK